MLSLLVKRARIIKNNNNKKKTTSAQNLAFPWHGHTQIFPCKWAPDQEPSPWDHICMIFRVVLTHSALHTQILGHLGMVASTCAPRIYGCRIPFARNQFDAWKVCIFMSKEMLLYQHFPRHFTCEDCTQNLPISIIFLCISVLHVRKWKHLTVK